ncbi:Protein of unknown function, partial [Gryllus bimaculatus]
MTYANSTAALRRLATHAGALIVLAGQTDDAIRARARRARLLDHDGGGGVRDCVGVSGASAAPGAGARTGRREKASPTARQLGTARRGGRRHRPAAPRRAASTAAAAAFGDQMNDKTRRRAPATPPRRPAPAPRRRLRGDTRPARPQ